MNRTGKIELLINKFFVFMLRLIVYLGGLFFVSVLLGYLITKTTEVSANYSLPIATVTVSFLSKSFFEALIRIYNYSQNANDKLNKHFIFFTDFSKVFSIVSVLVILFVKTEDYSIGTIGVIGFYSIAATMGVIAFGIVLAQKRWITEEDYTEKDNEETELIKSYRSLTEKQRSEILKSINSKFEEHKND
ncbi:hypothetical protein GCM10008931_42710 [Oceanobacillus oncorhynchi subsp. oncorhynchi]|uniref:hypothetical protein n=1 Tax=Oceanobacillus oncorhynchi TaxID=545501 RepID=UPI0031D1C8B1